MKTNCLLNAECARRPACEETGPYDTLPDSNMLFCPQNKSVIPHIPEWSLCSLSMTFNLSLHQSMSGWERRGGQG